MLRGNKDIFRPGVKMHEPLPALGRCYWNLEARRAAPSHFEAGNNACQFLGYLGSSQPGSLMTGLSVQIIHNSRALGTATLKI